MNKQLVKSDTYKINKLCFQNAKKLNKKVMLHQYNNEAILFFLLNKRLLYLHTALGIVDTAHNVGSNIVPFVTNKLLGFKQNSRILVDV